MHTTSSNYLVLPLPYSVDKKKSGGQKSRYQGAHAAAVKEEDFPSQSSYHVTGWRLVTLVVVLVGVTFGLLLSFFFLFSGAQFHLALPTFTLLSPWLVMSLVGGGGGVGIVLWRMQVSRSKRSAENLPARRRSMVPLVLGGGSTAFPPEPLDRRTDELFSFGVETPLDRWISSAWNDEPRRKTDALEALHMRQRLRTLRLYDANGVLGA